MCVTGFQPTIRLSSDVYADSVFVFSKLYPDSSRQEVLISATENLLLKKVRLSSSQQVLESHTLRHVTPR
jgi:hypothetical protein